jgi:hypothetical protein
MQVVKTRGQGGSHGRLRLGAGEGPSAKPSVTPPSGSKYNFAGVVGRLEWQGDAVEEQRKLRDVL